MWQRGLRAHVPTRQKRANFSFLRANKHANVPTCQRRVNFSTWRAKVLRRAITLTWRANVPNGVPFFQFRLPKVYEFFN